MNYDFVKLIDSLKAENHEMKIMISTPIPRPKDHLKITGLKLDGKKIVNYTIAIMQQRKINNLNDKIL